MQISPSNQGDAHYEPANYSPLFQVKNGCGEQVLLVKLLENSFDKIFCGRTILNKRIPNMRLILTDRNQEFCDVLRWQFKSHPEVQIVCGKFEDLPSFDCVVTAGNSFGLMDAGMDLAVVRFFGRHIMERIQKKILIVPTDHALHPYVAHAPTMRIPMNIQSTDHVYLAMWATLTAVHRHNRSESNKIDSVACPGLGTGTGGVDSLEAALQLFLAYEHYLRPPQFINPSVAQQRHERIYYGGRWGFMHARKTIS